VKDDGAPMTTAAGPHLTSCPRCQGGRYFRSAFGPAWCLDCGHHPEWQPPRDDAAQGGEHEDQPSQAALPGLGVQGGRHSESGQKPVTSCPCGCGRPVMRGGTRGPAPVYATAACRMAHLRRRRAGASA